MGLPTLCSPPAVPPVLPKLPHQLNAPGAGLTSWPSSTVSVGQRNFCGADVPYGMFTTHFSWLYWEAPTEWALWIAPNWLLVADCQTTFQDMPHILYLQKGLLVIRFVKTYLHLYGHGNCILAFGYRSIYTSEHMTNKTLENETWVNSQPPLPLTSSITPQKIPDQNSKFQTNIFH